MSTNPIDHVTSALRRLNLSDNEQTVYLSLLRDGQATARVLAARTGITRSSVYDQVKHLRQRGLIIELDLDNKIHFAASDPQHLDALLADQIDRLEQSRAFLEAALPTLRETIKTVTPKVRFFEGEEGLKQLLKDIMWHDRTTLQIVWATEAVENVYDAKFLQWFDERRLKRHLTVELLHPANRPTRLFSAKGDIHKPLPVKQQPAMTSIIFGQKVAFISSSAESFGFIVESQEFHALQTMQFQVLWHST